jgi:hypothetical protein
MRSGMYRQADREQKPSTTKPKQVRRQDLRQHYLVSVYAGRLMQRKGHFLLVLMMFTAYVASQLPARAAQTKQISVAETSASQRQEQRQQPTPPRIARTPLERIFLPGLQKRLAGAKNPPAQASEVKSKSFNSTPSLLQMSSASPNFGGLFEAPFYNAIAESTCIVAPDNCGVAAAVSGDFNKDGKPDIAVIEYDGTLNILLNDGAGGFLPPAANLSAVALNLQAAYASVADFNNDGYPDLIVLDTNNNGFIVYLNQGDGTFGTAMSVASSANGNIGAFAVGDVNGDGNQDVAVLSYNSLFLQPSTVTLQVFLGNGDGTFKLPTNALTSSFNRPIGMAVSPNGLALADLNNDKKLDLVYVLNETISDTVGQVAAFVALGNNDGTFQDFGSANPVIAVRTPLINAYAPPFSGGVYVHDLNGDNKPDLILSVLIPNSAGVVYSALGNGDGTFQSAVDALGFNTAAYQLAFADVNGDGYPDMICESDYLAIYPGHGDGTFGPSLANYVTAVGKGEFLSIGDYNGDGILDVVQTEEQASVLFGKGDGTFLDSPMLSPTIAPVASPENLFLYAAGDVNGDGNTDVILQSILGDKPIEIGLSDGKGNFSYKVAFSPEEYPNLLFVQPVTADFNGDGNQDMILVGTAGLAVALSNGDGTFQSPVPVPLGSLNCILNYAATGDLLGNGHQDIVLTYPGDASCGGDGSVPSGYFVILGNGDGTFATPQYYASETELYSAVLADMNDDGKLDLLLDDAPFDGDGPFAVYYLPGNGDGTFGPPLTVSNGFIVSQILAGDLNQDGNQDLVLLSEGDAFTLATAGILVYPGHGDGTFSNPSLLAAGNFFLNGVLTDLNGDGFPDLIVGLDLTNASVSGASYLGLSTLLGEGNGTFSAPVNNLLASGSSNIFSGNFLSDGAPDVVLQSLYGPALFLNQNGTLLNLTAAPASANQGEAVTLTAAVAASMPGRPLPGGTVTFFENGTPLGLAELNGGYGSFSTAALLAGTDSITAVYSGDANFNPNSKAAAASVTITSIPPAFTLTSSPATLSLGAGQLGSTALTLAANVAFSGNVSFAASGVPQNVSVLFTPGTVTLGGGQTATVTLVVSNTRAAAGQMQHAGWTAPSAALLSLVCFCFLTIPANCRRLNGKFLQFASFFLLAAFLSGLSGCGSGSHSGKTGISNITITATPSNAAASVQTVTVTLTVQ